MFDLELLKSFVSVVDAGGFTRAGERVHRTQSTVSQQIKRLEEDVGQILRDLERGDLDLALLKRDASEKGGIASWPERVHWVTSKSHPRDTRTGSVPLIGFPAGCLYRSRAIHALESAGRAWHMSYTSSSLAGIQAAVAAGMGLSILSEMAIQADHRVLTAREGFAPIDKTEVALVASPAASPATLRLADRLAEFCDAVQAKAA